MNDSNRVFNNYIKLIEKNGCNNHSFQINYVGFNILNNKIYVYEKCSFCEKIKISPYLEIYKNNDALKEFINSNAEMFEMYLRIQHTIFEGYGQTFFINL